MGYGIVIRVSGDYALFTRPEMKVERVSYDIITPSAARGIIEAVYWKPAIRWVIDRIHILNPIEYTNIRRNEVTKKVPRDVISRAERGDAVYLASNDVDVREQRAAMVLKNVDYVIEAHFERVTEKPGRTTRMKSTTTWCCAGCGKASTTTSPAWARASFPPVSS